MRIGPGGKLRLEALVGLTIVESGHTPVSSFDLYQHLRKISIRCRAADHGNVWGALEDLVAFLLRNAAEDAELFPLRLKLLVISETMKNLLLCFVSDGAGVVKHQASFLDGWN